MATHAIVNITDTYLILRFYKMLKEHTMETANMCHKKHLILFLFNAKQTEQAFFNINSADIITPTMYNLLQFLHRFDYY